MTLTTLKNLYEFPINEVVFFATGIIVAAFSDILLNDLSRFKQSGEIITSLRTYFDEKPILINALYAAITIFTAMISVSIIFRFAFGSFYPRGFIQLIIYMLIAYPIGYAFDVLIQKTMIFGSSLNKYYDVAGAGHWGAIAFMVAIIPSFFASYGISFMKKELNTCFRDVINKI